MPLGKNIESFAFSGVQDFHIIFRAVCPDSLLVFYELGGITHIQSMTGKYRFPNKNDAKKKD